VRSERRRLLDARLDLRVFLMAAALIAPCIAVGALAPSDLGRAAGAAFSYLTRSWGWLYLASASLCALVLLLVALSPLGRIRLGAEGEAPEFGRLSWFAMLFSAGMGIGLVFYAVAEPMRHFVSPPVGAARTVEAARLASEIFFFHWGIHPWAVYTAVGLALAYFRFRQGRPALISESLVPLMGRRALGGWRAGVVDAVAIWATVMGVVTSLGYGAFQIARGLSYLGGGASGRNAVIGVILLLTAVYILSAASGVARGIKHLSNLNVAMMLILMAFFVAAGPALHQARTFALALADYVRHLGRLSLSLSPFGDGEWTRLWTVFYWAWWIAWAPFVGAFIARISRGRTVREFVLGVMVLPALFSFLFESALGGTALHIDLFQGGRIGVLVQDNLEVALFETLRHLSPGAPLLTLANLLIVSFFVTSADSATYVLGSFSTGGSHSIDRRLLVFWGFVMGCVAAVLVHAGGIEALRSAAMVGSFPFLFLMVLILASTVREMWREIRDRGGGISRADFPHDGYHLFERTCGQPLDWNSSARSARLTRSDAG
jgi:glycine betaine transporter